MAIRLSSTLRSRLTLAAAVGGLVLAVSSAQGSFATGARALFEDDAASTVSKSAPLGDLTPDGIDYHDGLSHVSPRWRRNFENFAQNDRTGMPAEGGVVFVGSSSIDSWTSLEAQFADRHVLRRGLGGATMADCARHADRLVLPYKPRVVVVYAGDNDLAAGVTPEQVVADYADLVRQVHRELPATKIVFVSIKPSPSRMALLTRIERTNALMAAYTRTDRQLDFVDVFTAMLTHEGLARPELFGADGLHMTSVGYALWHDAIVTHLD